MVTDPSVPRQPDQVAAVMGTIWYDTGRSQLQCPVCAAPMEQLKDYTWLCYTGYCPIEGVEFNERVHSYGIAENSPYDPR